MRSLPLALLALAVLVAACGGKVYPAKVPPEKAPAAPVATTALTPPPGPFHDKVSVLFETDLPATLFVTTDGSDPHLEQPGRLVTPAPFTLELTRSTTLRFFSLTAEGGEERLQQVNYPRAGGLPGTISGAVVVGGVALDQEVGVLVNGAVQKLGKRTTPGELPFSLTGLDSGRFRLVAMADRNGDGNFWPLVDLSSDVETVVLDLADPFKASAEGVRLYLGASAPGLCTIQGTITLPEPPAGQSLSISALTPDALGASGDPQALLAQLRNGYQVLTNSSDTIYPYAITDLSPGRYVPVPVLTGFGAGGLAMNFLANPLRTLNLAAGEVGTADFRFGTVGLSGTVTLTPASAPTGPVYGIVAAKSASLASGIQGVLMPVVFLPSGGTQLQAAYAGGALRENSTFSLRVFTSLDPQSPLTSALAWTVNPFAAQPAQATVALGTTDARRDWTVP